MTKSNTIACGMEPVGYVLLNPCSDSGSSPPDYIFVSVEQYQHVEYRFRAAYRPVYMESEE